VGLLSSKQRVGGSTPSRRARCFPLCIHEIVAIANPRQFIQFLQIMIPVTFATIFPNAQ
jgi:hypothetical protein